MRQIQAIKKIGKILQIEDQIGQLTYNSEKIPVLTSKNGAQITGFVTILSHLLQNTKNATFKEDYTEDKEREFVLNQWIEYGNIFVHAISESSEKTMVRALLEELNQMLQIKSYLVGESITVADLIVFYFIQDTMKYLTYLEKENYLNLSRWFNHLQQLDFVQEKQINLSTTYLVGWTTGTHI